MSRIRVEAAATVAAPASDVYSVLADYHDGHPHILPPEHFRDLVVEEGGVGEGTVIRFVSMGGGIQRHYRMAVTEPEPGRVLVERDIASSMATTFTVTPEGDESARVRIATEWDPSPGMKGLFERLAYPPAMRAIYRKELSRLKHHMAARPASGG